MLFKLGLYPARTPDCSQYLYPDLALTCYSQRSTAALGTAVPPHHLPQIAAGSRLQEPSAARHGHPLEHTGQRQWIDLRVTARNVICCICVQTQISPD